MSTITFAGNLTRGPGLRYTPSGQAVAKFSVAVNRSYVNRNGEWVETQIRLRNLGKHP